MIPANLSELPNKELDVIYNRMRSTLNLEPAGKAKDKPSALARIEKLRAQYEAHMEAMLPSIEKIKKPAKEKSSTPRGRYRFNYPVQSKIKPPSRNGTKLASIVDTLESEGMTFDEVVAKIMEITGEKVITTKEMADSNRARKRAGDTDYGFCTDTPYRAWKELNNLAKKHGYGMRCLGDGERIYLFTSQSDIEAWDRNNRR